MTAPADPARFVEVTGERIALLGREEGPFECWLWPLAVFSGLRFGLLRDDRPVELTEREVTVLPGELRYVWKGSGVQLRTEIFACRERPGLAFGFALDSDTPLELELTFRAELRPMWPAGLGGQLAYIDPVTGAFALTEELGRFAVLVGATGARVELDALEHALPARPVRIVIPLDAGGSSSVLAIAGAEIPPDPLADVTQRGDARGLAVLGRLERAVAAPRELWFRLVSDFSEERETARVHWREHQERALVIGTPYPALDQAFQWAAIAIERSWVRVDGLGRGLVAGFGPSGGTERPGHAWFFDGDALAASRAMTASGDFAGARDVLRFAASHQRADGQLMSELSLSARLCRWLEDYPYAYEKGTTSADFVSALDFHLRVSGDLERARELWPTAQRAMEWCARALDAEGRLTNTLPGAKPRGEAPESEAFAQGAWIAALGAATRLALALGEDASGYRALEERLRTAFEGYWSEERGHYGFALQHGGKRCDELSAFLGYPLSRGLGERGRAWATVQALNDPALTGDWGPRPFAASARGAVSRYADSRASRDPKGELGFAFPYLTNFVTLALFAHGHTLAAQQMLFSQVALDHLRGLGFLEERPSGEPGPARGVPHALTASAGLIESVLLGLFGVETSAAERRVAFRPTLPPHWDEVRLHGLTVGETRLDVRFYRRREAQATVLGVELERGEGPALQLGFAPVLPPLTRLLDGPGWLRPSGAVVPRRLHRSGGEPLTLEARVLEGPSLLLPYGVPEGRESRAVRLVAQRLEGEILTWTLAGPAGTSAVLPFFCDYEVEVRGARLVDGELTCEFPAGGATEWTRCEVGVRAR